MEIRTSLCLCLVAMLIVYLGGVTSTSRKTSDTSRSGVSKSRSSRSRTSRITDRRRTDLSRRRTIDRRRSGGSGGSTCTRVDGGWGDWTVSSTCICATAGTATGTQTTSRSCTNPYPSCGGSSCVGDSTKTVNCTRDCTEADCLTADPSWERISNISPRTYKLLLPVENGKNITIGCEFYYYLSGSKTLTCKNGSFVAEKPPVCKRRPYWSSWSARYPPYCGNVTLETGIHRGSYTCAQLENRTCLYESEEYSCEGEKVQVWQCDKKIYCPDNSGISGSARHKLSYVLLLLAPLFLLCFS